MNKITLIGVNLREKLTFEEYDKDKSLIKMSLKEGNSTKYIYFKKYHFESRLLLNEYHRGYMRGSIITFLTILLSFLMGRLI